MFSKGLSEREALFSLQKIMERVQYKKVANSSISVSSTVTRIESIMSREIHYFTSGFLCF